MSMSVVPPMCFDAAGRVLKLGSVNFKVETLAREDVIGEQMAGFCRFLEQVRDRKYCQIAFSLNACLRDSSKLGGLCKSQPEMINKAHSTAEKMIPKVLGCFVEEGFSTFVLDLCKQNMYVDEEAIRRWEIDFAKHLRTPLKTKDGSAAAETHRSIRPWMSHFIAEGSIKCMLVRLMLPEEREYLQGDPEGKLLLCMMGLVIIHFLQYGFKLVHQASGAEITPAGIFHDLEDSEPRAIEDLDQLLAGLRADFVVMTMFPIERYVKAYSKESAYVALMSQLSSLRHAHHCHGRVKIHRVVAPAESAEAGLSEAVGSTRSRKGLASAEKSPFDRCRISGCRTHHCVWSCSSGDDLLAGWVRWTRGVGDQRIGPNALRGRGAAGHAGGDRQLAIDALLVSGVRSSRRWLRPGREHLCWRPAGVDAVRGGESGAG